MKADDTKGIGELIREVRTEVEGYRLTYALFQRELSRGGRSYSIGVSIVGGRVPDRALARDVARTRSAALALFAKIADGLVTPCTLFDVLEDML